MNAEQKQMAAIFDEWARRYAENPSEFGEILDAEGKAVTGYGERCAICFEKIRNEMKFTNLISAPPKA